MEQDLKWIKKHYGEKMMYLCREFFPVILEQEGLLPEILKEHFHPNKELAQDILNNGAEADFKTYIFSFLNEDEESYSSNKSVAELLDEAGYILYPECHTEAEIQSFKKYYRPDEALCTFNGDRLDSCRVWFAIKKNVDEIKREDFTNPKRQDEYGTSVISIQFTRDGSYLSIKNRYNHTVTNPDNTFNNNLDNIIEGLSDAFEKEFGVSDNRNTKNDFELQNYVRVNNKFYRYNYEINNIYYCPNNIIIDNFNVKKLPDSQMLVDYFIFDFKEKKIYCYDKKILDSFVDSIEKIDKMEYRDNNITIYAEGYEPIVFGIENGRIKSLYNPNLKECGDDFLPNSSKLETVNLPNLKECGDNFLLFGTSLKTIDLPSLEECGDNFVYYNKKISSCNIPKLKNCGSWFMYSNKSLTEISLPSLERCGDDFIHHNTSINNVNLPNLIKCGDSFLFNNNTLQQLELPKLENCGKNFLGKSELLKNISLPNLIQCGDCFLASNQNILKLSLPKLEVCGEKFLYYNKLLNEIHMPNLVICGSRFLDRNEELLNISLPSLKKCGNEFIRSNKNIESVNFPNLLYCGDYFLNSNFGIKKLSLPNLVNCGSCFMGYAPYLEELDVPSLRYAGRHFLFMNQRIVSLNAPSLVECGDYFMGNSEIVNLSLPSLVKCGKDFLYSNTHIKVLDVPNLQDKGAGFLKHSENEFEL